jgi:signal transduction histidine kinase/DNA-binding response OmpR family regulator/HAMP domain-containing protein
MITRWPIRRKVNFVAILVSTSVLAVSTALFLTYDLANYRTQLRHDLSTQAAILGDNCTAALAFGDAAAAGQTLKALKARPEVLRAVIYDVNGRIVAQFSGPGSDASGHAGTSSSTIEVEQQMRLDDRVLGRVHLAADLRHWYARATRSLTAAAVLLVVAALLSFLLSDRLHGLVTGPVAQLKETMQSVSESGKYGARVEKRTDDEVGELIDRFNGMLGEIQRRDAALQDANDQLRHQTGMLQSVLHSMADSVIVTDIDGGVTLFNPTAEDVLGLNDSVDRRSEPRFLLPDMTTPYPGSELPASRSARGESVDGAELYLAETPGRPAVWLSANARPLRNEDGEPSGAVAVFRDITEQKRVEGALVRARDAAEAASRAKSAFLANMSHELRTPLNAIIGYSELLEEIAAENDHTDYADDLRKVQSAGKHLLSLINGILDLSKVEAGRMEVHVDEFDVTDTLNELLATLRPLAEGRHNRLALHVDTAVGTMRSDVTKVRQILFNLLSNANKFTSQGTIVITARTFADAGVDWVEFKVQDSGIGIAPEQAEHLFQDFTQADASTTRKYGGTGLGLAISRRFCHLLNGEITLASVPGEGSAFTVRLPADARRVRAVEPDAASAALKAIARGSEVLVIDDDPQARQLIARHLQREGFAPILASSGSEGLALARERRPAVITLDVIMPGMDGWSVLNELQSDPALAQIPVVMLTLVADVQRGYALGASAFVQKPIDASRLVEAVRAVAPGGRAGRVLIVDDDDATRRLMCRHLQQQDCEVITAADGLEALASVVRERPDIIFLDLMMPNMDGFQFLEELGADDGYRRIPIVVITAKDVGSEERQLLHEDVIRVIQKRGRACETLLPEVTRLVQAAARSTAA